MTKYVPEGSLGLLIKRAQQSLRVALDDALRETELTMAQYAAMASIEAEPGLSNAALARRAFVTPQTMHGLVAALEEAGWAAREQGEGRRIEIHLTEAGTSVLSGGHAVVERVERGMTEGLGAEELKAARRVLLACCERLEAR